MASGKTGGNTKGLPISNMRAFVRDRHGQEGWVRLCSQLSEEDQVTAVSAVAVGWYPIAFYKRLMEAFEATFGTGDYGMVRELGRYEARKDMGTVFRLFARLLSPETLVGQVGRLWSRFNDTGTWELEPYERGLRGTLHGWAGSSPAMCANIAAYIETVLQITGEPGAAVTHPRCASRGDTHCEYNATW